MESCLSLLEDYVLVQAKPITIATLLDLSSPDVTLSCARRAMAQFALDHKDSTLVQVAVSYISPDNNRLEVRLTSPNDLHKLHGKILSLNIYSIEFHNADAKDESVDDSNLKRDRDQCIVTYRFTAEQEIPMLIREPAIKYPGGGPQIRRKPDDKVSEEVTAAKRKMEKTAEEPAAPKRKVEEPKDENIPTTSKPMSAAMTAFFARKQETASMKRETQKGKRNIKQNRAKDESLPPVKKGVAVKKSKNSERKPSSSLSMLESGDDSESSSDESEMEFDDEDISRTESERATTTNESFDKNENDLPNAKQSKLSSSSPKKAFTKKVVHHTYVQDKYLVTEDVVEMVEAEVQDKKKNDASADASATKANPNQTSRNNPKNTKRNNAAKSKPVQTSLTSYFSKR